MVNADETLLVFTSRRQGSTGGKTLPAMCIYMKTFIFLKKLKIGRMGCCKKVPGKVNTPDHEALFGYQRIGKRMFIYRYKGKRYFEHV